MPSDSATIVVRADLGFTAILLYSSFSLRQLGLSSELSERNSTKTRHMLGSECDLKMYVRNLGFKVIQGSKIMVPIDSPWVVSYWTSVDPIIVSPFLTCNFNDLELDYSRSKVMVPIGCPFVVSYQTSIVSNIVSLTVFEIFDVKVL